MGRRGGMLTPSLSPRGLGNRGTDMAIRLTADEVLQMAEEIERNGARFYAAAAEREGEARTQSTLRELAAWENRHEETFAAMRAGLSSAEREVTVFDPDQELPLYLRSLADRRVFDLTSDPTAWLTGAETMEQLLEFALAKEKDSIIFYTGLRDLVPPEVGRERMEEIIREEMAHISILAGRLRAGG